jgi:hypothetical protein
MTQIAHGVKEHKSGYLHVAMATGQVEAAGTRECRSIFLVAISNVFL